MQTSTCFTACRATTLFCFLLFTASTTFAQTTAFTYQGKLTDAGNPANGIYDLQFRLFDALVSGNQIGSTVVREDVAVNNGIFSVTLDFGAVAFPGANRFLEIAVRPGVSTGAFTTLNPPQPITATPYAIQSMNAATATNATTAANFSGALSGDVTGNQGTTTVEKLRNLPLPIPVQADDGKVLRYKNDGVNPGSFELATVSGVVSVTANAPLASSGGSTPNLSLIGQVPVANGGTGANLSVTGGAGQYLKQTSTGSALLVGTIVAGDIPDLGAAYIKNGTAAQVSSNFNISGDGTAGGMLSGNIVRATMQYNIGSIRVLSNLGTDNLFAGAGAGSSNTDGNGNSFFGANAGHSNINGNGNSFFGNVAGYNTRSYNNAFFGPAAGYSNTTGSNNNFFGDSAGYYTTGNNNAFFGTSAGSNNTTGNNNAFFGQGAGNQNTTGSNNTNIGYNADMASGALDHATAIGADAIVATSNSIVLGRAVSDNVGVGTTAPKAKLDVTGGNILVGSPGQGIILKSPDGTKCTKLSIDNTGALQVVMLPSCP